MQKIDSQGAVRCTCTYYVALPEKIFCLWHVEVAVHGHTSTHLRTQTGRISALEVAVQQIVFSVANGQKKLSHLQLYRTYCENQSALCTPASDIRVAGSTVNIWLRRSAMRAIRISGGAEGAIESIRFHRKRAGLFCSKATCQKADLLGRRHIRGFSGWARPMECLMRARWKNWLWTAHSTTGHVLPTKRANRTTPQLQTSIGSARYLRPSASCPNVRFNGRGRQSCKTHLRGHIRRRTADVAKHPFFTAIFED